MIGTIRRHSQWLWWIIVAAVIVSFVWFYGSSNRSLDALFSGRGATHGVAIFGEEIRPEQMQATYREVQFGNYLQERSSQSRRPRSEDQTQTEVYQQVLIQRQIEANGIIPGSEAVGVALREEFKNPNGAPASPEQVRQTYEQYLKGLESSGYTEADFAALLRRQIAINHLRELVSVPAALVTPREATAEFQRENETVLASAVILNLTNYLGTLTLTDEVLGQYYSNNLARYRTPERVGVNYVRFDASNHLAEAEGMIAKNSGLALSLDQNYRQQTNQNPNAFVDVEGKPLSKEAALVKIREEGVKSTALQLAYKEAATFYNGLGQKKVTSAGFADYAAGSKVEMISIPPVTDVAYQPAFSSIRNAAEAMASLNPTKPFTQPLSTGDAIIIAALRERVPSEIQPLSVVRLRTENDYKRQESLTLARTAARILLGQVTNALASGKSFAELAQQQGFTVTDLPAYSSAMNQVEGLPTGLNLYELKNSLASAKPGEVRLLDQGGSPSLVYLKERKAVAEETVKAGISSYTQELRQRRQYSVFNEWFRQKFEDSGLAAILQPKTRAGQPTMP